jgi:hypothetical protein
MHITVLILALTIASIPTLVVSDPEFQKKVIEVAIEEVVKKS